MPNNPINNSNKNFIRRYTVPDLTSPIAQPYYIPNPNEIKYKMIPNFGVIGLDSSGNKVSTEDFTTFEKRTGQKINTLPTPQYGLGGFIKDTGEFLGNYGKGIADVGLSTFGADNVIKDSDYHGTGAKAMKTGANIVGGITKAAAPIVAGAFLGPAGSMAVSALQQGVGQFNPEDNSQTNQQQKIGAITDSVAGMAGQVYGMGKGMKTPSKSTLNTSGIENTLNQGKGFNFACGGMKYPNDGIMPEIPNAEVEKEEFMQYPNGQTDQVNGPSHENGGVPVNIPNGTRIFSDRLKTDNKKTFAKEAEKYHNTKYEKILKNPNATSIEKKTAQLMLDKNNRNLDLLFNKQEELKQSKLNNYATRLGITSPNTEMLPPMCPNGGEINNYAPIPKNDSLYIETRIQKDPLLSEKYQYKVNTGKKGDSLIRIYPNGMQQAVNFTNMKELDKMAYKVKIDRDLINQGKPPIYNVFQYANGGMKLPKYAGETEEGFPTSGTYNNYTIDPMYNRESVMSDLNTEPILYNTFGSNRIQSKPITSIPTNNISFPNPNLQITQPTLQKTGTELNDYKGLTQNQKNALFEAGNFGVQNFSNIRDIIKQKNGKNYEKVNYGDVKANLLDPSASLRDADVQSKVNNYNLQNALGNNPGALAAGLVTGATNNYLDKARVRNQYDNQNASILNQTNQFNKQNEIRGIDATAHNKAVTEDIVRNAYNNIGQNMGKQYKDYKYNRNTNMETSLYAEAYKNPEFMKILKEKGIMNDKGEIKYYN